MKALSVILVFSGTLIPISLTAQSVIYKKDGSKVTTSQVDKAGNVRTYKLTDDPEGNIHYISKDVIDSIRYKDGSVERFNKQVDYILPEEEPEPVKRNSAGVDVGGPIIYILGGIADIKDIAKLCLFYERLIFKDDLGLKNYLFINLGSDSFYDISINDKADFYLSSGLNYYFLKSRLFRFGTGLSFLVGRFHEEKYLNYSGWHEKISTHGGILFNTSIHRNLGDKISISGGIDIPVGWNREYRTLLFRAEISYNF